MAQIVPRNKAPGVDFCGNDFFYYIVRSDLGCYMRSTHFNQGKGLEVFSLHNSCRGGEHYLAHQDDHFYIIKGDQYRRVFDMNKDTGAVVDTLHPNCHGGDHYLSSKGCFYIIFQDRGVYRQVSNMNTDEDAIENTLHPDCKDGLYYWSKMGCFYFVKPSEKWGAQYVKCNNLQENFNAITYSFHIDVLNFLPGGLAITQGPSFGKWELLKSISNDRATSMTWNEKITRKVGYTKQKMSSIEHNWNVSVNASYQPGLLAEAIAKFQFSLSAEYGGKSVNTEQQDWSEATEIEESINVEVQPHEKMYVWQYQLGLGQESALFCRSMKFTNDSNPPTEIPFPSSKY